RGRQRGHGREPRNRAGSRAGDRESGQRSRAGGRRADRGKGARKLSGDRGQAPAVLGRGRGRRRAGTTGNWMMSLAEAAAVLGSRAGDGSAGFTGVSTDTRSLPRGDLFVALRCEGFAGIAFIDHARWATAAGEMYDP